MDPLFTKTNLLTTKDARELSGYTADYLARLARANKVAGMKDGRSWFIEKESLERFITEQKDHKADQALALMRERKIEYQKSQRHRSSAKEGRPTGANAGACSPFETTIRQAAPRAIAFATATLVITAGFLLSGAPAFSSAEATGLSVARTAVSGFEIAFGDVPRHFVMHTDAVSAQMAATITRVAVRDGQATAVLASPILEHIDFSALRMPVGAPDHASLSAHQSDALSFALRHARTVAVRVIRFVSSPSRVMFAFADAYRAVGDGFYRSIVTALSSYEEVLRSAGNGTLALAAGIRDAATAAPSAVLRTEIALGTLIINGSHAAINADVTVAYTLATALPEAGQSLALITFKTGDMLATAASRAPAFAAAGYLWVAGVPATVAPEIAQAVFSAEYAGAVRFVALTDTMTGGYWRAITGTGRAVYAVAAGTNDFSQKVVDVALASLGHASQAVAAVASAMSRR